MDLTKCSKLHALLKADLDGYVVKKGKTFSTNEIKQCIGETPDNKYLLYKVIFAIVQTGRRNELHKLEYRNVNDFGSTLLGTIKDTKINTGKAPYKTLE